MIVSLVWDVVFLIVIYKEHRKLENKLMLVIYILIRQFHQILFYHGAELKIQDLDEIMDYKDYHNLLILKQ